MTARLIDGKTLAAVFRTELSHRVEELKTVLGVTPHLAAVLVGQNAGSEVYVRNKRTACEKAGLSSSLHRLADTASTQELLALIDQLNADPAVHGILVQLPLPKQIDPLVVLDRVHPLKDVDCFHPENVGLMFQGRPRFLPCTPHGVQQMLIREQIPTAGQHVVILGRSEIVGKPQAILMLQKGTGGDATVTVCHSRTKDLAGVTRTADILIAAIGIPEFVKPEHVKPGVVVIDVGINRVGERIVGDVQFDTVREIASAITPVPGGVGPMTIAMLLENTLRAAVIAAEQSG